MAELYRVKGGVLEWRGKEFFQWQRTEMDKRLSRCGELVASQTKRNISVSTKSAGPSAAGEFPHVVHGRLRNSIFWLLNKTKRSVTIGTPLWYGLWLEQGTSGGKIIRPVNAKALSWMTFAPTKKGKQRVFSAWVRQGAIAPRPFLSRTLKETEGRWRKILLAKMTPPKKP